MKTIFAIGSSNTNHIDYNKVNRSLRLLGVDLNIVFYNEIWSPVDDCMWLVVSTEKLAIEEAMNVVMKIYASGYSDIPRIEC